MYMQATIDAAGRLILPAEILQQAGLRPGMSLEVRWLENRLEIEPAPLTIRLVRKGHLLVAVAHQEVEPLSAEAVEQTRKTLLQERSPHT
jgi:bifunctional DNA-binding transcriptional regulator/antitoxin component of YhaV-PrlF toxin-antitoxin module